jgi:hypothetical protein
MRRSLQLCTRNQRWLHASSLRRLHFKPAAPRAKHAELTASSAVIHHDHQSAWREAWGSFANDFAVLVPVVGLTFGLTFLYVAYEEQACTPAARAKQVAGALKAATMPARLTGPTKIERPEAMAALKAALEPLASTDGLNETVLVTGPIGSGKSEQFVKC